MKIYEVHYDNGEPYCDAYHCSEAFFLTYESAVAFLKEREYYEHENCWYPERYICANGNTSCCDCECDYETCPEVDAVMDSAYDRSFCRIIEHEVQL